MNTEEKLFLPQQKVECSLSIDSYISLDDTEIEYIIDCFTMFWTEDMGYKMNECTISVL